MPDVPDDPVFGLEYEVKGECQLSFSQVGRDAARHRHRFTISVLNSSARRWSDSCQTFEAVRSAYPIKLCP